MKILNVGCGEEYYGDDRVDFVKTDATTLVHNIEEGLPYESYTYDEVYCSYVFEHMKNPYNLLKEMYRVCKPNGKVVIYTDNASYLLTHLRKGALHGNHIIGKDKHYALYTMEHMRNFFNEIGLEVLYNELIFWEKIDSIKSRAFHYTMAFLFGKRFWLPTIKIIGRKK